MTDESVNEDYRMKTYISLDIGGTAIKYGLISEKRKQKRVARKFLKRLLE